MTTAEGAGRTVDEAVEHALRQLGVTREDVEIEVLQEARPAILGLGGREARVRLVKRPTPAVAAQAFVTEAVAAMGHEVTAVGEDRPDGVKIVLFGNDLGGLIGRRGHTLDALELLTAMHLQRQFGRRVEVSLDAERYRAKREKVLLDAARRAASRAVREQKEVPLEPMTARDRRTVHLALREDRRVETTSRGEGDARRVVVIPKEPFTEEPLARELPAEEPTAEE